MSVAWHGQRKYSIGLIALAGAWMGHFAEYVRVYGWHRALSEMTSPAHSYFFPAGAALMALLVVGVAVARRAWRLLGLRLRAAEVGLWTSPRSVRGCAAAERAGESSIQPSLLGIWGLLLILQLGTWIIQENLESVAAGRHAPMLSVLTGTHIIAPLIQGEFALISGVIYWLLQRRLNDRRSRVFRLERLVARRWTAAPGFLPAPVRAASIVSAPLDRWGAQRWKRPPPASTIAA